MPDNHTTRPSNSLLAARVREAIQQLNKASQDAYNAGLSITILQQTTVGKSIPIIEEVEISSPSREKL